MLTTRQFRPQTSLFFSSVFAAALMSISCIGLAQPNNESTPTYSKDIAPIINEKCSSCHNPEGIGPMSLLNFDEVKPFAPLIMVKVEAREMPPWHLDRTTGIQRYKNDASLTDTQIKKIVSWVKGGSPEGDLADLPPSPILTSGKDFRLTIELGEPDFVVKAPPYTVTANAQDQWWVRNTPFEGLIDEPRYVRATELKGSYPLGVKVLHHGHAVLISETDNGRRVTRPLGRQGVGKAGDLFPKGTGMLIHPSGMINWNLHYFPISQEVVNEQAEAAVWLYPKGYKPELETVGEQRFTADAGGNMPWAGDIVLPPHSIKMQQGIHVLDRPALISSFRPHMHMRGREQALEAIFPNGERVMLGRVDRYNHNWQISYEFEDDAAPLLPKGTMLMITTTWDNTANNPINPDPRQWVVFGQRGVDEMSHIWLGMTYLSDEQYDKLFNERGRMGIAALSSASRSNR